MADLAEGGARCVLVRRKRIALFRIEGQIYATDDICSHAEASLSEGEIEGGQVICPLHGARFDIKTGRALTMPAVAPIDTYEVRVENGEIYVKVE